MILSSTLDWIFLIIALSPLLIGLLAFIVYGGAFLSMIGGQHLVPWEPADEEDKPPKGSEKRLMQSAERLGLLPLGRYQAVLGKYTTDVYRPYLSEDGCHLMLIMPKPGVCDFGFFSRMADGVWLASFEIDDQREKSPCFETAMMPGLKAEGVFFFHRERVTGYDHPPVPFDPETLVEDYANQQHARAEHMVGEGMARWVDPARSRWKGTLRGAFRQARRAASYKHNNTDQVAQQRYRDAQDRLIKAHKAAG